VTSAVLRGSAWDLSLTTGLEVSLEQGLCSLALACFVLTATTRLLPQALAAVHLQLLWLRRHALVLLLLGHRQKWLGVRHLRWQGHR